MDKEARKRKRRLKKRTHNTERQARLKRAKKTKREALRKVNWKFLKNYEQETASLTKLNIAVEKIFFELIEDVLTELAVEEIDEQNQQNEISDHFSDISLDYDD